MATRDVLFIQGAGPRVHAEWDSHLVASLRRELGAGYAVRYPRMPHEADPTLARWRPVIERELSALPPGAVAVGHSVGGTSLVHVLADLVTAVPLGAVVLIAAPFLGEGGWASDEVAPGTDLGARFSGDVPVLLYHGEADAEVPVAHVGLYAAAIPGARVCRLAGRDHQLNNDLSEVARDILALDANAP